MKTFEIRSDPVIADDGNTRWLTHYLVDGKEVDRVTFFKERVSCQTGKEG